MAFDWISNLFQSEQTRGLSGGSQSAALALDDSNPYYNYRLRRHKAEGDLVYDPGLLWFTSPYVKRRSGLGTHIASEMGEGVAGFTDVLLILSQEDYTRAVNKEDEPWLQSAAEVLLQEFENHCRRENFELAHKDRSLGFRILCDGSPEMGGQLLGLESGEFVTGLLPNLYTGPEGSSYPVIGVHLNIPGAWEGYQEVGRLYSDQLLFTLGSHWLDNFSHPHLREAALYRLQQYPNGSFVHIINPDLQDRYQVTSTQQGDASVLTLATREGEPLAYMVLAVMEAPQALGRGPHIDMPDPGEGGPPTIPPPMMLDDEPVNEARPSSLGQKTIIPDAPSQRIFTLQERGALLQKVHFSAFMLGYDVYLSKKGDLGTVVDDVAATFQVRKRTVALVADIDGVVVNGREVAPGVEIPLDGVCEIVVAGQKLEYRDLREFRGVDGWPYVGEIRRPASSTYMMWGDSYRIGRSRECRVVLPDEVNNENIHWKPSVGEGTHIRARTGEIPKSRFYTDSIMVASAHAEVVLDNENPLVRCTANHCYAYIRRDDEIIALFPASSGQEPQQMEVEPGDEVLIGNCLFHIGYMPPGEAVAPAPAPKIELSSDALVDAVSEPSFDELDEEIEDDDVPAAGGFGEPGRMPDPVPIQEVGMDSILGQPLDEPIEDEPIEDEPIEDPGPVATHASTVFGEESDEDEPLGSADGWAQPDHGDETSGWDDESPWADEEEEDPHETWDPHSEEMPKPFQEPPPPPAVEEPPPPPEEPAYDEDDYEDDYEEEEDDYAEEGDYAEEPQPEADEEPPPADDGWGEVIAVDDEDARFELGRGLHVVMVGWSVNGTAVLGNHTRADLILPENRLVPDQELFPFDYFLVQIRGRRGSIDILAPEEVLVDGDVPDQDRYEDLEDLTLDVIRRDDRGEEDFTVRLSFVQDRRLPDPRARLIAIDHEDPLAAALLTLGLPLRTERVVTLGAITMTMTYDGETVTITDYLDSYRLDDGFSPFFVQRGKSRFKTAPEDGVPIVLEPGDRMVVGHAVYVLRKE